MIAFIEPIMDSKGSMMSKDERVLVTAACKGLVDEELRVLRTITAIESFSKYSDKEDYIEEYRDIVKGRLDEKCVLVNNLIKRHILDSVVGTGDEEQQCFF